MAATEICIIHSSPIILKGIEAIVQSLRAYPCYTIKFPSDLLALQHIMNKRFILFVETNLSQEYHQAIHALKSQNSISIVSVVDEEQSTASEDDVFVITHYSGTQEIAEIIEEIERSQVSQKPKEESEHLSVREKEVLQQVALGLSNKEIAEVLHISIHTVISHRKNIVEKLGIKSISGLTMYAVMTKIIDPDTIDISKLI